MRLCPSAAAHRPGAGRQRERIPAVPLEPLKLRGRGRSLRKRNVSATPTGEAERQLPCRGSATSPGEPGGCCGARRTFAPRQCSGPPRSSPPDTLGAQPRESLHLPVGLSPETLVQNSSSRHPRHRPEKVAGMVPPPRSPASDRIRTPRAAPPEEASSGPERLCRRAGDSSNDGGQMQSKAAPNSQEAKSKRPKQPPKRPRGHVRFPLRGTC